MHKPQTGFTLIELLVVLVLLGLVAGVGVANLGGGNLERELQNEANRLHAVLRMGSEEAIISNNEIGVYLDAEQYGFVVYDEAEAGWVGSGVPFLRDHVFPEWLELDFQRRGEKLELPTSNVSDEVAIGEEVSRAPDLMLLSSGEVSEFVIGLQIKQRSDTRIEILTNDKGEIVFGDQNEDG